MHEVTFENVPSFAAALDVTIDVPGYGSIAVDVGYGGAFYALVDAAQLGWGVSLLVDCHSMPSTAAPASLPIA